MLLYILSRGCSFNLRQLVALSNIGALNSPALYLLFSLFYRKYCRPTIGVFGVSLHNAHSSRWVKVPTALYEGLDGFLVELTSLAVRSVGLQQKDLIIECNGEHVATSLQLFEILSGNIGKMVKVTFKAEDRETHSVFLPVEETLEKKFYSWPISEYNHLC